MNVLGNRSISKVVLLAIALLAALMNIFAIEKVVQPNLKGNTDDNDPITTDDDGVIVKDNSLRNKDTTSGYDDGNVPSNIYQEDATHQNQERQKFESDPLILFHFIVTTSPESFNWRNMKALETVYFHHPNAEVIIHSRTIPSQHSMFDRFRDSNYNMRIQNYSFEEILRGSTFLNKTKISSFLEVLDERRKRKFWYSHETDLIRLLLLEQHGGIYIDTDIHFIKPVPSNFINILGFQGRGNDKVNGAVMMFEKHNLFIQECLDDAITIASGNYDKRLWEIFGPDLLTRHWNALKNQTDIVRAVSSSVFYPYGLYKTKKCFVTPKDEDNPIREETIAVHLNNGITKDYNFTVIGTVCDDIFKNNCIFCDFNHTIDKSPF